MKEKQPDPEFTGVYYFIQVVLVIVGIVIGFGIWTYLDHSEKPNPMSYPTALVFALLFVNLHRIYTIKKQKKKQS